VGFGFGLGISLGGWGDTAFSFPFPFFFPLVLISGPGSGSGFFFDFLCFPPPGFFCPASSFTVPGATTSWLTGGSDSVFTGAGGSGGSGRHRSSSSSTLAPRHSMNTGLSFAEMKVP